MTILYADDDVDDREIFSEAIRSIGKDISCHIATNGLEALSLLDSLETLPDITFLDINMPLMNGRTCLAEIKATPRTSNVNVIMFTTSINPKELDECRRLGAAACVNKPGTYRELTETLEVLIHKYGQMTVRS